MLNSAENCFAGIKELLKRSTGVSGCWKWRNPGAAVSGWQSCRNRVINNSFTDIGISLEMEGPT